MALIGAEIDFLLFAFISSLTDSAVFDLSVFEKDPLLLFPLETKQNKDIVVLRLTKE